MYHYRKLRTVMLLLLACVGAKAQLTDGKVYNFVNVGNSGQSMTITSGSYISIVATDEDDYKQLWYAEGDNTGGYTLRNLYNGYYLRSSNGKSSKWTMVREADANCKLQYTAVGSNYVLRATNTSDEYHYMHYGASNDGHIVGWEISAPASQWTIGVVEIDESVLDANWERLAIADPDEETIATYQEALDHLFSDKACTMLKKSFSSDTDVENDADYKKLPAALQRMVFKVRSDNWAEDNSDADKLGWDSEYAKKYRVQFYEPYNEPECGASALGIWAHTNLNNPTGIFADEAMPLYVMVQGAIKEGAELYLASYTGHGNLQGYSDGVQLKEGLNVIPSFFSGTNFCVNYVVKTFDTSDGKRGNDAKARRLSEYDDLKIHIEGGYINGYWNRMGDYRQTGSNVLYAPDKAADWDYIEQRATQTDVTVLGEYITLQFPLRDEDASGHGLGSYFNEQVNIEASIAEWDKVMMWERFLLGLLDEETTTDKTKNPKSPYSDKDYVIEYTGNDTDGYESGYGDYYNVHGLSLGSTNGYPYGSWNHCGYPYYTVHEIMVDMAKNSVGAHWAPAHEIGHQHQNMIHMRGETEVSNNLFSNVVLWYLGESTSRVNGSEGALSNVLVNFSNGGNYLTNSIWGMTQMYYKLFLYYHVLGHNPKFYPKLFEMLRQDQMDGRGGTVDGAKAQLHLYKKVCMAAGEDLTEFFRAYGFFVPLDGFSIDDYGVSKFDMTQEQIDAAIAEVKEWGYEENISVLFVNDATGEEVLSHKGNVLSLYDGKPNADMGGYASFGEVLAANDYTYSVSGNTIVVEGNGGVGIVVYNEEGEIIAFSDKKEFTVSDELAASIASGEIEFAAVNADNSVAEVKDVMDTDDTEAKYAALGEILAMAEEMLALTDDTGKTYPGYYKGAVMTDFTAAYDKAKEVYDAKTVAAYDAAYDVLYQEYLDLRNGVQVTVPIFAGSTYVLTNVKYPAKSMASTLKGVNTDASTTQQWTFEAAEAADCYYIKNVSTNTYLGVLPKSGAPTFTATTTAEAVAYKAFDLGDGKWALQCQNVGDEYLSLHCDASHNIVGWYHTAGENDGSWWKLTAVNVSNDEESKYKLQALIEQTEALMDGKFKHKLDLQIESSASPCYLSTNACHNTLNNASDGQGLAGLTDESTATYFHSDYHGKVSETHYLQMDLGSGNEVALFKFNYATRDNGNNCPTTIVVTGSTDGVNFNTNLGTFNSGLPTGSAETWESPIITNTGGCRYLRFSVTATENSQKYFVMSTFGLTEYTADANIRDVLENTEAELLEAQELCNSGSATSSTLQDEYEVLNGYYTELKRLYDEGETVKLNVKKSELQTLIEDAAELINSCGTVLYTPATLDGELALQTSNPDGDFYVSTNADQNTGGGNKDGDGIAGLVDNDTYTYFHSRWSGTAVDEAHYIQVDLGEGHSVTDFMFKYVAHDAPDPKEIVVSGSNDGSNFTPIQTITKAVIAASAEYESEVITSATPYRYLRFTVTSSERSNFGATFNYQYLFAMKEFDLIAIGKPESYDITWTGNEGNVTEELLLEAYHEAAAAQSVHDMATTEEQLQKAIDKLETRYNELLDAKNSVEYKMYTVSVVGGNGNGGVKYKGTAYKNAKELRAPTTLTVDALEAIALDGYTMTGLTLEGTAITVTYRKWYTVQVVGGNGNGRAAYRGAEYADGGTFDTAETLGANAVTAKSLDGYTAEVTLDEESKTVTVTYRVELDTTKYYTLNCMATDHSTFIRDDGAVINGRSAEGTLFSFESADGVLDGYYIKSYVSGKYLNHDSNNTIYAGKEKVTVWIIAIPSHTPTKRTFTAGSSYQYLNNAEADCKDGSCTGLQSKEHNGGTNNRNACSLWTLTEGTPLDKSALLPLIEATNALLETAEGYTGSVNVTKDLVEATRAEVDNAQAKYDDRATTQSEYTAALTALQTAHDNLQTAINYAALPVQITFDANSPVAYKIAMKRDGTPVLQYDSGSAKVAVSSDFRAGDKSQGWYFMAAADGQVYIMPCYEGNTTLALSTNDFSVGAGKVKAVTIGTEGYTQGWTITANTANEGWYNITTPHDGTTWYFSNYGGVSNKMGFYNDANDGGTLFKFEQISFDKSEAYYTLYNYYTLDVKLAAGSVVGSDAVGYYSVDAANAYNSAYNNATSVLGNSNATDEDYTDAYNALKAANEALVPNMPAVDKYYVIESACNDHRKGQLMYATSENAIKFSREAVSTDAASLWRFTNEGYLENLQTGCGVSTASTGGEQHKLGETPKVVAIEVVSVDGQVLLTPAGAHPLHAQDNGSVVVGWDAYTAGSASAWRIVEVKDMSPVNFALTIGKYRHAGLYLNYAVTIPEGVKAYIAHTPDGDDGTIYADELDGTILPARTAVIVKGDAATYNFKFAAETGYDGTDDLNKNRLGGSAYLKYQQVVKEGNRCCVFGQKGGEVGLYKNYVEYTDANGSQTDANKNSVADTDNGTHFKISANKIYYEYEPASVAGASAFRFRFNGNEEGTTAIDRLMMADGAVIYNLYGQRIAKVVKPGIYVVNGKKIYVSEKMIRDNN